MQNGYVEFGLYMFGVFLIAQTIRHIKYLNSLYGGKYPLLLLLASLIYPVFAAGKSGYFSKVFDYFIISFFFWLVYIAVRLIIAFRNSEMWQSAKSGFQKGQNLANYQIGGAAFGKSSSGEKKKSVFGTAAAPPPPKKEKNISVQNTTAQQPAQPAKKEKPKQSSQKTVTPYSASHKLCATCALWGGAREIDTGRIVVRTEGPNVKGKCLGGGHNNQLVPATGHCAQHQKWSTLR